MGSHEHCRGADFCDEIAGDSDITFNRVYNGLPVSRRIASTKSFVVIADLSPLTVGHLLVLPRDHYLSFAELIPHHLKELRELLDWLIHRYRETFGEPTILEHGSAPDFDHSACITHAHWHLVPVAGAKIRDTMAADGLSPTELRAISDLSTPQWANSAYFLVWYSESLVAFHPRTNLCRQYLRSVISRPLNISEPEWDYAVVVRKNYLRTTIDQAHDWTPMRSTRVDRS